MNRRCLREPIDEIFEAASLLEKAVEAHLAGNAEEARTRFRQSNMTAIWDWSESIWGKTNPDIHRFKELPSSPPHFTPESRPKPRMPNAATKKLIVERDGYHCRFCSIPVVPPEIRRKITQCYPDVVPWERNNISQHAAFQCMWLQFDHILPNKRGGDSGLENLVITCAPCNFGRMMWTVEESELIDPRDRPIVPSWNGFHRWRGLTEFRP